MSADSRTPHTDALETLGSIHTHSEQRDAIHLAVEPVIAAHKLKIGEDIGIKDGKAVSHKYSKNRDVKLLGIVDPFLKNDVEEGQSFWLVIYPRQITSLRHVWSHPDIVDMKDVEVIKEKVLTEKEKAYKWISDYASELSGHHGYDDEDQYADISAEELIETALTHVDNKSKWGGDYLVYGGLLEGVYTSGEFWDNLAIYLERDIPEEKRNNFFSCSC